ncbi:MAG TPA: TlpA disulfide reductase family protein [Solimonas sp.]|nr:TlpA disulfide reductase family protein [Solimonas sp.]
MSGSRTHHERERAQPAARVVLLCLALAGPAAAQRAASAQQASLEPAVLRVLVFWDRHCMYCAPMLRQLQQVAARHAPQVRFYAVSTEEPAQATAYLASRGLDFAVLRDDGSLMLRYGVVALPWVVVTDGAGRLVTAPSDGARASQVPIYLDMELSFRGR